MDSIGYLHIHNALVYYHGDMCLHFSIAPIPNDWEPTPEKVDNLIPEELRAEKLSAAWRVLKPENARNATDIALGQSLTHNVTLMAPPLSAYLSSRLWEIIQPVIAYSNADFDFGNKRLRSFHDLFPENNGTSLALLLIGMEHVGVFVAHIPE